MAGQRSREEMASYLMTVGRTKLFDAMPEPPKLTQVRVYFVFVFLVLFSFRFAADN
jgi:hypothetical protein